LGEVEVIARSKLLRMLTLTVCSPAPFAPLPLLSCRLVATSGEALVVLVAALEMAASPILYRGL
jgi:hypothetical protein